MSRFAAVPLLLLLPFIYKAGRALAGAALRGSQHAVVLAPGLALACWLLAIHVLGLLTHSFHWGLFLGSLLVAGCGAAAWRYGPNPEKAKIPSIWMWAGMLVMVLLLLGPELRYAIFDEDLVAGHLSFPAEIQNGIYPPRHPVFPAYELRYHYAIDLAAATFSTVLGKLDMTKTVHGLALLLWGYSFCVFWTLGKIWIGGPGSGLITGLSVMLAGGFNLFCRPWKPAGALLLLGDCSPTGIRITPPLISNFLQHPWSLGIPLAGCILIVFQSRTSWERWDRNPTWYLTLWILFCLLALSQVVLFICLLPACIAAGCLSTKRIGWRLMTARLLPLGLLIGLSALRLHGFFAHVAEPSRYDLVFHSTWYEDDPKLVLVWFAEAFGFALPLGLAGFYFLKTERVLLALIVGGSFLVRSLFGYQHSWDIVKFSMVTQLFLGILSAATLVALWRRRRGAPLAIAGLALTCVFAVGWVVPFDFDVPGNWYCKNARPPVSAADYKVIDYLRTHVAAGDMVFRSRDPHQYSVEGGIPEPSWDWGVETFGYSQSLFDARDKLLKHPSADVQDYLNQSFRWFVVGPEDHEIAKNVEAWELAGRAQFKAEFPPLQVYRLQD